MARTISPHLHQFPTERLGVLATTRTIRSQLMAQRHHQESPIRTHHGTHSLCTPDHPHLHIPISRNTPPKRNRSTATSDRSHQTVSGTSHTCPNMLHPLLRRRQSLA